MTTAFDTCRDKGTHLLGGATFLGIADRPGIIDLRRRAINGAKGRVNDGKIVLTSISMGVAKWTTSWITFYSGFIHGGTPGRLGEDHHFFSIALIQAASLNAPTVPMTGRNIRPANRRPNPAGCLGSKPSHATIRARDTAVGWWRLPSQQTRVASHPPQLFSKLPLRQAKLGSFFVDVFSDSLRVGRQGSPHDAGNPALSRPFDHDFAFTISQQLAVVSGLVCGLSGWRGDKSARAGFGLLPYRSRWQCLFRRCQRALRPTR